MKQGLHDRVVILTGASRGLGSQVARACAQQGARVALLARSEDALAELANGLNNCGGTAAYWAVDLSEPDRCEAVIREIFSTWGRVDCLMNVAGTKVEGSIEGTDRREVQQALDVNFLGPWSLIQAVLPRMRERKKGHIINVSSVLGKRATPSRAAYSASKAALNSMTEALRTELAGTGIHVSLICPGRLTPDETGLVQGLWVMNERRAAERIVRCLLRPRREVVLTAAGRVLVTLNAVAPGLLDRLLSRWKDRS